MVRKPTIIDYDDSEDFYLEREEQLRLLRSKNKIRWSKSLLSLFVALFKKKANVRKLN